MSDYDRAMEALRLAAEKLIRTSGVTGIPLSWLTRDISIAYASCIGDAAGKLPESPPDGGDAIG